MHPLVDDITDQEFDRWTAKVYLGKSMWQCECVCGSVGKVHRANLVSKRSTSCGCSVDRSAMGQQMGHHGLYKHPLYRTWSRMHERCTNPNHVHYHNYGGRNIQVCTRWSGPDGFPNFIADMGAKPLKTTLERRENHLGYSPDNCYWATAKEQNRNRRNNKMLTFDGKIQCMSAWADELQVPYQWLHNQMRYKSLATVIQQLRGT